MVSILFPTVVKKEAVAKLVIIVISPIIEALVVVKLVILGISFLTSFLF